MGFDDIRCDIVIFGCGWLESGDFVEVLWGFCWVVENEVCVWMKQLIG